MAPKKDDDPEVREALDALMRLRKIKSLSEIAQKADCALSHLSSTYNGKSTMSVGLVLRICEAFNLKRSQFFRMGEVRHQFHEQLEAEIENEGVAEDTNRQRLEAMIAKYPEAARELLSEYFNE